MILDERTSIFMSLAASVAVNCQPCLNKYVNKAKEAGISAQEIKAAISVGRNVKKGAAGRFDEFIATLDEGAYSSPDNID
jgi:AhpD family alkylhydroperoxidase